MSALTDQQQLLDLARQDLGVYMALVHRTDMDARDKMAVPYPHHQRMIQVLQAEAGDCVIVQPRGAGKTTVVQAWIEWELGRASLSGDPDWAQNHRVLYVTASATQAYKVSNALKNVIEFSPVYQAIFPKVKKYAEKWSESEWRVKGNEKEKDPTFQAMGILGPALGSRATRVILDDVGDRENMSTPHQREQIRNALNNTIKPIIVPEQGRFAMLGTRWAWDDAIAWAQEQGWFELYQRALDADESYWPERFSVAYLEHERRADPKAFARQYQNEVAPDEGMVFERDWFLPRFEALPAEAMMIVNSWDTAAGEGRNRSYTVGLAGFVSTDWHIYIMIMLRGQVNYSYQREFIAELSRRTGASHVLVEKKSTGEAHLYDSWYADHVKLIPWQPAGERGTGIGKEEARFLAASYCQRRDVHLPSEVYCRRTGDASWLAEFENELFAYPDGTADDVVSALTQLVLFVEQERGRWERSRREREDGPSFGRTYKRKLAV